MNNIISFVERVVYVLNTFLFEKEIQRLNKKAARLGIPLIKMTRDGLKSRTRLYITRNEEGDENVREVPVDVTQYTLQVPTAEARGWITMARYEKLEGNGVFFEPINWSPTVDMQQWKDNLQVSWCDHCRVHRPRNHGYIVMNADGVVMQMGSKCYADTVGKDTLAALEFCSVIMSNISDEDGYYPKGGTGLIDTIETARVIAMAEALYSVDGWIKNQKDDFSGDFQVEGTHRIAAHSLRGTECRGANHHGTAAMDLMKEVRHYNEGESEVTGHAKAWANAYSILTEMQEMEVDSSDEFATSLKNLADYTHIPAKKAGLAAYMGQFLRNQAARKNAVAANEARRANSQHVGSIGARMDFNATVRFTKEFDGQYGVTVLTVMDDDNGNVLTWFGKGFGVGEGSKVAFKATVKAHNERDGIKQTQVTRAKFASGLKGI